MAKYNITIEEVITEDFEIEIPDTENKSLTAEEVLAIAEEMYQNGELAPEPGELKDHKIFINRQ